MSFPLARLEGLSLRSADHKRHQPKPLRSFFYLKQAKNPYVLATLGHGLNQKIAVRWKKHWWSCQVLHSMDLAQGKEAGDLLAKAPKSGSLLGEGPTFLKGCF